MTHTKDEAMKLALEALELHGKQYPHMVKGYCLDAITAIKQALAADVREPVATLFGSLPVYETPPVQESKMYEDWYDSSSCGHCGMVNGHRPECRHNYKTPAQPAVPDAMTSADIQEHIEYVAGWNDCRQAMLEMMK